MIRWLTLLTFVVSSSLADARPKNRQVARIAAGTASSVSGAVVLSGFLFARDSLPFNKPLLYSGIGLLSVTPSVGQFYAGQLLTVGMGVRAAAAAFAVYTLATQTREATCQDALSSNEKCETFEENAYPMLGLAAIAFVGGVWYDVLDAGDAVDRYNRRHGFTVAPAPVVLRGRDGVIPGLALSGAF